MCHRANHLRVKLSPCQGGGKNNYVKLASSALLWRAGALPRGHKPCPATAAAESGAFFVAAWFLAFDADIRGEQSLVQVTVGLFRNFGPFAILGLGYVIAVCVLGFVFELLLGVYFQHPSLFTVLRDAQNRRGEDARCDAFFMPMLSANF